jgi:hypothetical protein
MGREAVSVWISRVYGSFLVAYLLAWFIATFRFGGIGPALLCATLGIAGYILGEMRTTYVWNRDVGDRLRELEERTRGYEP